MTAVGISDINGVYALPRAFEAVRDQFPNMKLICGSEISIQDQPSVTLIAKTRTAWALLCRIITQVHAGKEKGSGFISKDELEFLCRRFNGASELVCILKNDESVDFDFFCRTFSDSYLSICRYLDGFDHNRTSLALSLAKRFNLPLVASNDVHYHHPEKRFLQDCLVCIRESTTMDNAGFLLFANDERFLKSPEQMRALFSDLPQAIENTIQIASKCTFSLKELKYAYPKEAVPDGFTADSYLKKLVYEGAVKKYRGLISEAIDRQIRRELDFFSRRGEADYFLTMYDILKDAQEKKIVFQGRGSAASSIVCYCLGITAIDPISANLLFDRFANEARPDPPDIDVDFEHERREEVIQGIYQRFGRDRAGMVAAVHTYRRDSAYREICKSLGVEVGSLKAEVVRSRFAELAKDCAARGIFIDPLMQEIKDYPRHIGTHSGGFVITHEPLVETVPIEPARMPGRTIVQWDKHDLETLGMMKIDILSIGFLTAIRKTTDIIGMNWQDIPINDEKSYRLIQRAETAGCFQIESRAQMNSLPHTKPSTPYEMTIQVALIRPSMSIGGMSRSYLRGRENARRGIVFDSGNSAMNRILGRTHGVAMFPEQIMSMAMDVCGFSSREADQLRRSLGQERSAASVQSQGEKLFHALIKSGIKEQLAQNILDRTQGFASYGFPEAHAASYGSLAFKSAYLKAHYPAEFLCALINSQPMGFYRIDFLINEAKRSSGVKILPVHILESDWDAKMAGPNTIRMGFRDMSKIREPEVKEMITERNRRPFDSIEDFIARNDFGKNVIQHLMLADAFACFGLDRRHSFWKGLEFSSLVGKKEDQRQFSFFDETYKLDEQPQLFAAMTDLERAIIDYRLSGYSLNGSLMRQLKMEIPSLPSITSTMIKRLKKNALVHCTGILLVDQRPPPAKGVGFITLEDDHGTIDLVLKPEVYDKFKPVFRSSRFLIVTGKIQRIDDHVTVLAETIESFAPVDVVRNHQPTPRMLNRLNWNPAFNQTEIQ